MADLHKLYKYSKSRVCHCQLSVLRILKLKIKCSFLKTGLSPFWDDES